jgi:phenylalanyl-tRNA synthetase beta chain
MKISYHWLQSHIAEPLPQPAELAEKIIFGAFEVESTEQVVLNTEGNTSSSDEQDTDWVFDVKVLPDRAHDCLSHQGMAREIAGLLGLTFKKSFSSDHMPAAVPTNLKIDISTDLCRRYMGRIIRNVHIGPSPDWMKNYLTAIGQRSINNLVDATNIVMFDLGQPTHAFDIKKINQEHIIVKQLEIEAPLTTLSGEEKVLMPGEMVIASHDNTSQQDILLAIAGVKGGNYAEVDEHTTDIMIEVANFDPVSVRKTARRLNILTDSAKRFENELTPEKATEAMLQLSMLIAEICPDAIFEEVVDVYPHPLAQRHVQLSAAYLGARLGVAITPQDIARILQNYGYEFAEEGENFTIAIPFERIDITGPHDMIEEIGRAYGYHNIVATLPILGKSAEVNEVFAKIIAVRTFFASQGYHEVMNYSFVKKGGFEVARGPVGKSALRNNLSEGLRGAYEMNRLNKDFLEIDEMKIFEIGTVFLKEGEQIHVAIADKQGIVEKTLDAWIQEKGIVIGELPYIDPLTIPSFEKGFTAWSEYPSMTRDIAVWTPAEITAEQVQSLIHDHAGSLVVKGPRLFDTFTKDDRTSYAFRLVFQSPERTLVEDEVNRDMANITQALQGQGWEIR